MFTYRVDEDIQLAVYPEHQAETIYALMDKNRARIRQYFGWMDHFQTVDDWRAFVAEAKEDFAQGIRLPLSIFYQGQIVGDVMLTQIDRRARAAEISYWLDEDHTGKGIMTRVVKAVIEYAFRVMNFNRIVIRCAPDNTASCGVAERLGFRHEGVLRQDEWLYDHFTDLNLYAMLKQDWTDFRNTYFEHRIDDHISLRLLEERDAEILFDLIDANREHIAEWLSWVETTTIVDHTKTYIQNVLKHYVENDGFVAGIYYEGTLVGTIDFHYWDFAKRKTEIGYWLSKDYNGKGIMTKAVTAFIDYAFDVLDLNRVGIYCATGNDKSCAIPMRLGFHLDGVQRAAQFLQGQAVDWNQFSILKDEWQKRTNV